MVTQTHACRERFTTDSVAESNFERTVASLGMSYEIRKLSKYTSVCLLKKDGIVIERGNGKGVGLQSILSAKFEALEHYFAVSQTSEDNKTLIASYSEMVSCENCTVLPLPFRELIESKYSEFPLEWRSCSNISDGGKGYIPFISINPLHKSRNYPGFTKFCSNNGTATGSSYIEAAIHALSEIVERDALSIHLYTSYVLGRPIAKIVDKSTLPENMKAWVDYAEHTYNDDLTILDITTDLDIPVYLVTFTNQPCPIQPTGTGCSWIRSYALERAILEAIQIKELSDSNEYEQDKKTLLQFQKWPSYYKCVKMPINHLIKILNSVSFEEKTSDVTPLGVYESLLETTHKRGIDVYATSIYQGEYLDCIKLVSPQLELFHLCQHGHFSIPGERIRMLYTNDSRSKKPKIQLQNL